MLTHANFNVTGNRDALTAFDARLKVLVAEHGIAGTLEESHTADALHYDLKIEGGIPFPPFALASGEFPDLTVTAEWVDPGSGVRGTATIAGGTLTAKNVEHVAAGGTGHATVIRVNASGYLALALAAIRKGHDECRGYMLTGAADALFRITREGVTGEIELWATEGAAEWGRAWRVSADCAPDYREISPAQPIADDDFRELEKLAQDFVAQWIWFGNGPREEIAIEAERYARMGYEISDANLRSAALHRLKGNTPDDAGIRYSTLAPEIAWIEEPIARCWPGA